MYVIYKVCANPTVDFAAEELKKYLRMMMPRCGHVPIVYDPNATEGFRLGLMQDFGLDVSDAADPKQDDILYIDTDEANGIIAGSNYRSVLLAVYRYLNENGCRWLFPGVDGEYIPMQAVKAVKYRKKADLRVRAQCNEGAEYQPNMMEIIDFQPKIGMNVYMLEFDTPFSRACLYNVINARLLEGRPTVISTNLSFSALQERYGDQIASRISGGFVPLLCVGKDIRQIIRRQSMG